MRATASGQEFRLAPMCGAFAALTSALWLLPLVSAGLAWALFPPLLALALFLLAMYASVWFWFRPTRFLVAPEELIVEWPWRTERLARRSIRRAETLDAAALKQRIGRGVRIGAGGLWGGFGLLKITRAGTLRFYISRLDNFVWIDRGGERAWLITPDRPGEFVAALRDAPHA
jgi:hypothetical protein